jgi:hypothetical protein
LLNEAANYFGNELTPQEEAQIASLSSATPGWQTQLAAQLSRTQAPNSLPPSARSRWIPAFLGSAFLPRAAFALALAAAVGLGIRDYTLSARLSSQSHQAGADLQRLQKNVLEQSAQIAVLTAQLNVPAKPADHNATRSDEETRIASLALDTGLTRGAGETKRLSIPAGASIVRVFLHIAEVPPGVIHEELQTVEGKKLWSQEMQPSGAESKSGSLTLFVPASLLAPDDYLIVLSHAMPEGPEELATYSFRVPR